MTTTIDANDAPQQWLRLLALAKAGNEVVICEERTPVARLTAVETVADADAAPPLSQPRVAGLHAGAISVSEDFDEPLPDEFWVGKA